MVVATCQSDADSSSPGEDEGTLEVLVDMDAGPEDLNALGVLLDDQDVEVSAVDRKSVV